MPLIFGFVAAASVDAHLLDCIRLCERAAVEVRREEEDCRLRMQRRVTVWQVIDMVVVRSGQWSFVDLGRAV
jgi:hypothetical protein